MLQHYVLGERDRRTIALFLYISSIRRHLLYRILLVPKYLLSCLEVIIAFLGAVIIVIILHRHARRCHLLIHNIMRFNRLGLPVDLWSACGARSLGR